MFVAWLLQVSDWYEFWHYQDWDHDDLAEELDDEHDAVGEEQLGLESVVECCSCVSQVRGRSLAQCHGERIQTNHQN